MATTNNRARVSSILGNNRVMLVVSILLAIVIWLAVSINEAPVVERTVKDVKVVVDDSMPNQLGYKAYGADNLYVDVTVSGKRYEVGDNVLSADDITVTAITSSVDSPGKYTLQLRAAANVSNPSFKITGKSEDSVEVYFDTPKSVDVTVEPKVRTSGNLVDTDKYLTQDPIPSQTSIAVSGPATYVDRIAHAYAVVDTGSNLKNSETYDAELKVVDEKGDTLKYLSADAEEHLTVTIPVYRKTTLPVTVSFSGTPSAYISDAPSVTIRPSSMDVAVDPDKLKDMKKISIGTIDFSRLEPGTNTFTLKASDMTEGVPLDEDETFTVTVEMGNLASRTLTIAKPDIKVQGNATDFTVTPSARSTTVVLYGPEDDLAALTASNISFQLDLSGKELETGTTEMTLTPVVNSETCWVYGTYKTTVTITN